MHPPEPSNILNRLRATYRRRRTPKDEKCICSETSLARNPVEKSLNCRLQRKYTDHGQQQCGLFKKLPPEIRNAIYAELFALEEPLALKFVVHSKKKFKIRCAEASWLLAFPKTCWQAYVPACAPLLPCGYAPISLLHGAGVTGHEWVNLVANTGQLSGEYTVCVQCEHLPD